MPTTTITWQNVTHASVNGGGDLVSESSGTDECFENASATGDKGARSVETVSSGDWEFQCTCDSDPTGGASGRTYVGIASGSFTLDPYLWQYALHVSTENNSSSTPHPPDSVFGYEGTSDDVFLSFRFFVDGIWNEGDLLRIVCQNNVVRYYLNSLLMYTSSRAPSYPIFAVGSMACLSKRIVGAKFITSGPCSSGSEESCSCEVEVCGNPWTIPTTDPLPLISASSLRRTVFQEVEGDWGEFSQKFGGGKIIANTIQTTAVRKFIVEWDGLDQDDAQVLDEHHENVRGGLSFSVTHPQTAEVITGVRYVNYESSHIKNWAQSRRAELIKYTS